MDEKCQRAHRERFDVDAEYDVPGQSPSATPDTESDVAGALRSGAWTYSSEPPMARKASRASRPTRRCGAGSRPRRAPSASRACRPRIALAGPRRAVASPRTMCVPTGAPVRHPHRDSRGGRCPFEQAPRFVTFVVVEDLRGGLPAPPAPSRAPSVWVQRLSAASEGGVASFRRHDSPSEAPAAAGFSTFRRPVGFRARHPRGRVPRRGYFVGMESGADVRKIRQ